MSDYFIYGHSIQGLSHVQGNIVCQDAHLFHDLGNGWVVAAVSDGVGSAKYSDIGSKLAVKTAVEFMVANMPISYRENGIKRATYLAFNAALKRIRAEADNRKHPHASYDCTLSMVIYNGATCYYGHAGDGGIFGLTQYGDYLEITMPHKGQDGITVVPLSGEEDTWTIDACRERLSSVLLATDGVRDAIKPYKLGNTPKDVYVPICSLLMHPALSRRLRDKYRDIVGEYLNCRLSNDYLQNLLMQVYYEALPKSSPADQAVASLFRTGYVDSLIRQIDDDKTALAIINTRDDAVPDLKDIAYYAEPNWTEKQAKATAALYPGMKQPVQPAIDRQPSDSNYPMGLPAPQRASAGGYVPPGVADAGVRHMSRGATVPMQMDAPGQPANLAGTMMGFAAEAYRPPATQPTAVSAGRPPDVRPAVSAGDADAPNFGAYENGGSRTKGVSRGMVVGIALASAAVAVGGALLFQKLGGGEGGESSEPVASATAAESAAPVVVAANPALSLDAGPDVVEPPRLGQAESDSSGKVALSSGPKSTSAVVSTKASVTVTPKTTGGVANGLTPGQKAAVAKAKDQTACRNCHSAGTSDCQAECVPFTPVENTRISNSKNKGKCQSCIASGADCSSECAAYSSQELKLISSAENTAECRQCIANGPADCEGSCKPKTESTEVVTGNSGN